LIQFLEREGREGEQNPFINPLFASPKLGGFGGEGRGALLIFITFTKLFSI
jgi:hypothetical protein